jgi:DNA-binding CsgD family transcriptional regulator
MPDYFLRLVSHRGDETPAEPQPPEVRVAVYDSPLAPPQVVTLSSDDFDKLIGELSARTHGYARERGGRIPFVVIKEILENLIHAYFKDAVVTILDDGNTIRISDQGPGIPDGMHDKVFEPGFTTATREMRRFIKGVGSGLPVAQEQLKFLGGAIEIENNLRGGTVVTLRVGPGPQPATPAPAPVRAPVHEPDAAVPAGAARLNDRQKKILLLIAEIGAAGPSTIAKELKMSQSTAFRELSSLQRMRLLTVGTSDPGKRTLTEDGIAFLGTVFKA